MTVPKEFTADHVAAMSAAEDQLYTGFLKSGQPYRSFYQQNFHTGAKHGLGVLPGPDGVAPPLNFEDDDLYYNTTGAAADYWSDFDLPAPTKDLQQLRHDLKEWGYCLIEDGLSRDQYTKLKKRLTDQAEAERKAGIANWMGTMRGPGQDLPAIQFVHSLINKGQQFVQCVEHDPEGVQAGPLIEQLLNETMGRDFLMSSFIAIISQKNNQPQGLHQDQATAPFQDPVAPYTVNTMFIMDDTTAENGGTLVVPGSHKILSAAGSGNGVTDPLPPAINLEAPAGTVMIFEGRLLHGTGVNRTDQPRAIMVMNAIKPFMRQQEVHALSARRDVLEQASHKLLYRLGMRPLGLGGVEGSWNGDYQVLQRFALEDGTFQPVGELTPDMSEEELGAAFTYRQSDIGFAQKDKQPETLPGISRKFQDLKPGWAKPGKRFPGKGGGAY